MLAYKVGLFDIMSQQCGNVCDQCDYARFVFWFLSSILFDLLVMTFTKVEQSQTGSLNQGGTQKALNMAVSHWKLL